MRSVSKVLSLLLLADKLVVPSPLGTTVVFGKTVGTIE